MDEYTLIRSNRKSLGLEITPEGNLLVRAPRYISQAAIEEALVRHRVWIRKHKAAVLARQQAHPEPSETQKAAMIARSQLEFCEAPATVQVRQGRIERRFELPTHGISLLEIRRKAR